ncbi:MAG: hypothetical protein Q9220_007093 [cf. Caloplaca sp. 1 TL-2023]
MSHHSMIPFLASQSSFVTVSFAFFSKMYQFRILDVLGRCILIALFLTHVTLALPLEETIAERDVNCGGGPIAPYNEACWSSLKVGDWLDKWYNSVPTCGDSDDGSHCCYPSSNRKELWSTCFLRLALENADYNCGEINNNACSLEGFRLSPSINGTEASQYRYVVRNIYGAASYLYFFERPADDLLAMNNLFNTWYTAAQFATTKASLYTTAITTMVDPEKKSHFTLGDILTALTAGLALLGLPEVSAGIQAAYKTVGSVVSVALQQAPGVGKAIWPSGTISSQIIQIGNLDQALGNINGDLTKMMNGGLNSVMADHRIFKQFASTGAFSGPNPPSLAANTANLDLGLKTFVLSTAMSNNNWRGSWENLPASGGLGNWPGDRYQYTNCKDVKQPYGICESRCQGCDNPIYTDYAGWPNYATHRGWTMDQSAHKHKPTIADMTNAIVDNGWSDLNLLFEGAYNCTVAAQDGKQGGKKSVQIGDDGTLNLGCLSQLPIIKGCGACPVAPINGGTCQFPQWDGC